MSGEMKKYMRDYVVNRKTMAILPVATKIGEIISKVFEEDEEFLVFKKPLHIIEASCLVYGSSFHGRKDGTKQLIDITHKAPICLNPTEGIYFFSTVSHTRDDCAWLSHLHVIRNKKTPNDDLLVRFSNNRTIKLPISQNSFMNQRHRTAQLRAAFEDLKGRQPRYVFEFVDSQEIFERTDVEQLYVAKWEE